MAIRSLRPHPRNDRIHPITEEARAGLVESVRIGTARREGVACPPVRGWKPKDGYRLETTITVNRANRRVLGGHRRLEAIRQLGQSWIHAADITWVEYVPDSEEELECLVRLNNPKIAGDFGPGALPVLKQLGEKLPEIAVLGRLPELRTQIGRAQPTNRAASSTGADTTIEESYQVVVTCDDETDQEDVYERLTAEGYRCRVLTL